MGMTTRTIKNEADRSTFIKLVESMKLPITASATKGAQRSVEQNRLQHLWHSEAADQLQEYSIEEYRGYCKAMFGIPIMCENEAYRDAYDRIIRPLSYEDKILMMQRPLDYPVTRHMTTLQKSSYLDKIYEYYTSLGVKLTEPI